MRAALVGHHGVDLIDDDRIDAAQRLPHVRGQHQIDGLRGGDQDVRRLAQKAGTLRLRCVACADGDGGKVECFAALIGEVGDPGERCPKIAFDVDREGLERGDVDHAAAPVLWRDGIKQQTVQAPEERSQSLPAAGRCKDQRPVAACDRRPAHVLSLGRGGK